MDPTASDPTAPEPATANAAPESASAAPPPVPANIWLHGLLLLVMIVLTRVAEALLALCAVIQFFWLLFTKARNESIAEFGVGIANWMSISARFLSGHSDKRPFPWTAWK